MPAPDIILLKQDLKRLKQSIQTMTPSWPGFIFIFEALSRTCFGSQRYGNFSFALKLQ